MRYWIWLGLILVISCSKSEPQQQSVRPVTPVSNQQNQQALTPWQIMVGGVGAYESVIDGTALRLKINNTTPFTEVTLENFLVDLGLRLAEGSVPYQEVDLQVVGENGKEIGVKMKLTDLSAYAKKQISQPELIRRMEIKTIETLESIKRAAKAAREAGRLAEAELFLKKWTERESSSVLVLSLLGNVLRDEKNYGEAIRVYEKILSLELSSRFALLNLGVCYDRIGALSDAGKMYQKVLELDPQNGMVMGELAEVLRKNGDPNNADSWVKKGLALGEAPNLWMVQGNILRDAKKYSEALEAYDKARQLNPSDSKILFNSILVCLDQKNFDEAKKRYAELLAAEPAMAASLTSIFQ